MINVLREYILYKDMVFMYIIRKEKYTSNELQLVIASDTDITNINSFLKWEPCDPIKHVRVKPVRFNAGEYDGSNKFKYWITSYVNKTDDLCKLINPTLPAEVIFNILEGAHNYVKSNGKFSADVENCSIIINDIIDNFCVNSNLKTVKLTKEDLEYFRNKYR